MVLTKEQKRIIGFSLVVYYLVLVWVIMFKMGLASLEQIIPQNGPEFIPFGFVFRLFKDNMLYLLPRQVVIVILNFLLFIPLGLGIRALTTNKGLIIILALFLGSVLEVIQAILKFGIFDLWDLFLNIGVIFYGYALYKVIEPKMNISILMKVLKVLIIIGIVIFIVGMVFAIKRLF